MEIRPERVSLLVPKWSRHAVSLEFLEMREGLFHFLESLPSPREVIAKDAGSATRELPPVNAPKFLERPLSSLHLFEAHLRWSGRKLERQEMELADALKPVVTQGVQQVEESDLAGLHRNVFGRSLRREIMQAERIATFDVDLEIKGHAKFFQKRTERDARD
jgi:hypothetical protein